MPYLELCSNLHGKLLSCKLLLTDVSAFSTNGKSPKISNTEMSDKMTYANSADPGQTAPEGGV